jgi:hypothetical protein
LYYFGPNDAPLLHGAVHSRTGVRQGDPLSPLLFNLAISTPLRIIGERCKDSAAIQAFFDDGKYLIKTPFVSTVITVATGESGKVCSRVQAIKSSCMVPPDTAPKLADVIRAMVPIVTGTTNLGAPLAMDFSMADGPPASHNENYVHSWSKTPWRLINSSWTRSFALLCRTSERDTSRFSLDDRVCGTPLWAPAPHPAPTYLPTVPCY